MLELPPPSACVNILVEFPNVANRWEKTVLLLIFESASRFWPLNHQNKTPNPCPTNDPKHSMEPVYLPTKLCNLGGKWVAKYTIRCHTWAPGCACSMQFSQWNTLQPAGQRRVKQVLNHRSLAQKTHIIFTSMRFTEPLKERNKIGFQFPLTLNI